MKAKKPQIETPSEHQIQAAYISIVNMHLNKYPELGLVFAVPNAAKRSPRLAAYMKAEGLKPGVPDIFLPFPRNGYTGMVIEFKSSTGKLQESQSDFMEKMSIEGWLCTVERSAEAAWKETKFYLTGKYE